MSSLAHPSPHVAERGAIDALRVLLERRALALVDVLDAPVIGAETTSTTSLVLAELTSFREIDSDLLRELVISMLGAFHSRGVEAALWIRGDGTRLRFFLGQYRDEHSAPAEDKFVRTCAEGFLKGAEIRPTSATEAERELQTLVSLQHAAIITGIPSERDETAVQTRLDEALEALAAKRFELLVRLSPVDTVGRSSQPALLDAFEADLSQIVNAARALQSMQETTEIEATFRKAFEWSCAKVVEQRSIESTVDSYSTQHTRPTGGHAAASAIGSVIGALIGLAAGPAAPIVAPVAASVGGQVGSLLSGQGQRVRRSERSSQHAQVDSESEERRRRSGTEQTERLSQTASIARLGREAEQIEKLADAHLERVQRARAVGSFLVSVVVATRELSDIDLVAHTLVGALRGDRSHLEPLRVIPVGSGESARSLLRAMVARRRPQWNLQYPALGGLGSELSTLLNNEEAALWLRPPSHPIAGVSVLPSTRFHRRAPQPKPETAIHLGKILIDGRPGPSLAFARGDLRKHCFVAGTTGSGKTTTVQTLLRRLDESGVPFLLLEPAKSEYQRLFADLAGARRSERAPLRLVARVPRGPDERRLAFNPFRPVAGIPIGRYVDQIRILLQSCFAMQESLPQILEALVVAAYRNDGLNLSSDMPEAYSGRLPTFAGMLRPIPPYERSLVDEVIERLRYASDSQQTLRAALRVRLESFVQGQKEAMFSGRDELDWSEVLRRPCFIELSDISDPYVRRFILGAIVLRIAGEREAEARRTGQRDVEFRHLLVLEEAHHFLRQPNGMAPGAELVRQSNELLTDALAELRSYGQGILIADQSPAELAPAVLRNTNIKIAHGLFYEQDCQAMGDGMGIKPENRIELRRLRPGECLVQGPGFDGPVHVLVDRLESAAER